MEWHFQTFGFDGWRDHRQEALAARSAAYENKLLPVPERSFLATSSSASAEELDDGALSLVQHSTWKSVQIISCEGEQEEACSGADSDGTCACRADFVCSEATLCRIQNLLTPLCLARSSKSKKELHSEIIRSLVQSSMEALRIENDGVVNCSICEISELIEPVLESDTVGKCNVTRQEPSSPSCF